MNHSSFTFTIFHAFIFLSLFSAFSTESPQQYLYNATRETIENFALAAESYHRSATNTQYLPSGLKSFIRNYNTSQLISYTSNIIRVHPELTKDKFMNDLKVSFIEDTSSDTVEKLKNLELSYLIKLALACEAFENENYSLKTIGGLNSNIYSLPANKVVNIIHNYMMQYPELWTIELVIKNAIAFEYIEQETTEDTIRRTLETESIDTWRNWGWVCEQYSREKNGNYLFVEFYIYIINWSRSTLCDYLTNCIANHFSEDSKNILNDLTSKYGFDSIPLLGITTGIDDSIYRTSLIILKTWALTIDHFLTESKIEHDSIADSIETVDKTVVMKYIRKYSKNNNRLNSKASLNTLSEQYNIFYTPNELSDFINKLRNLSRDNLIISALTCEEYHHRRTEKLIVGGLSSYINKLTNLDIINYVIFKAESDTELQKFDWMKLAEEYGWISDKAPSYPEIKINDKWVSVTQETLKKWWINAETYHRDINNLKWFGNVSDYIGSLSRNDMIKLIVNYINKNKELDDEEKWNSYNKGDEVDVEELKENLKSVELVELKKMGITIEKYHREYSYQILHEGWSDLFKHMEKTDVIEHIIKNVKEHKELRDDDVINSLMKKYGV